MSNHRNTSSFLLWLASIMVPLACMDSGPDELPEEEEESREIDRHNRQGVNGLASGEVSDDVESSPPVAAPTDFTERVVSEQERQRMVRYLDDMYDRDAVVHSFVMPSGDEVDCVDLYDQPALRRADMAHHELEFAPRTFPQAPADVPDAEPLDEGRDVASPGAMLQGGHDRDGALMTCPQGTVPIRRLGLDTLTRFETLEDFRHKIPSHLLAEGQSPQSAAAERLKAISDPTAISPRQGSTATHQYAHAYRWVANMGAESNLNLWNPYTEKSSEFSLSQIWVTRGSGSSLETVEAGWQKYKDLYGDWNARLFIYFTPDNYGSGGCYNLSCGSFVQVDNSVVIGGSFSNYSVTNGAQYAVKLFWFKDGANGHWWLKYGDTWVGYYPRSEFDANGLEDQAALIDYGGEIIDSPGDGVHTHTDMGSGAFANQGWQKAAYQRNIRYVDTSNFWQEASGLTATYTDYWCYDILLYNSGSWNNHFYFGGSGYNTYCQ